ncbi:MAG TPA: hypothetical protein VH107_13285, partial [Lacipirellulaceae bacterium]|nr:hypothetical protein [Lacipirellulaceae bacterium]
FWSLQLWSSNKLASLLIRGSCIAKNRLESEGLGPGEKGDSAARKAVDFLWAATVNHDRLFG